MKKKIKSTDEKTLAQNHKKHPTDSIYDEMNDLVFKKCFKNLVNNYKVKKGTRSDK